MHTTDKQRHMTKEKSHGQILLKTGQVNQETFFPLNKAQGTLGIL